MLILKIIMWLFAVWAFGMFAYLLTHIRRRFEDYSSAMQFIAVWLMIFAFYSSIVTIMILIWGVI